MLKKYYYLLICLIITLTQVQPAFAMHISEGFLPAQWCVFWSLVSFPFILFGIRSINKIIKINPRFKMLLVFAGAFTFILSALKIPSVSGSCSHPTGVGLGAILFGATSMTVISSIVLIFQALLLAHGGITSLGANIFSMGIMGPISASLIYRLFFNLKSPQWLSVFSAATLGNLITYITTSIQLAMAFPSPIGGFEASLIKFLSVYAFTQLPLAISEGLITVVIFNLLSANSHQELEELKIVPQKALNETN